MLFTGTVPDASRDVVCAETQAERCSEWRQGPSDETNQRGLHPMQETEDQV